MNIVSTGTCPQYEEIKEIKDPKELFMEIHGVGSVKANQLAKIGFKTIDDIRNCETIENYLNETQLKGLRYYEDIQKRIPYLEILKHEKLLLRLGLYFLDLSLELIYLLTMQVLANKLHKSTCLDHPLSKQVCDS